MKKLFDITPYIFWFIVYILMSIGVQANPTPTPTPFMYVIEVSIEAEKVGNTVKPKKLNGLIDQCQGCEFVYSPDKKSVTAKCRMLPKDLDKFIKKVPDGMNVVKTSAEPTPTATRTP